MPLHNAGLEQELGYITKPLELERIRGLFEDSDPIMHDIAYNLIVGNHHEVDRLTKQALDQRYSANTILDDGLIAGMAIVGIKFRDNLIFVPEVLVAARAMKAGMAHLEPILSASGIDPIGTVIMGTVKGDLHDIGKNLCIMMLRGAGFVVHDLGVDTKPEEFIDAVMEHEAQILGMSALLTTTMPNMGKTIEAFEEAGLRDMVKVMVGGAPVMQEFADDMGADGYGENAIDCVELAKGFVGAEDGSETESVPTASVDDATPGR
jgi:5-methyltetrahydrofolate--homocysteine methyltransferase